MRQRHYLVRWRVAGPGNTLNVGVQVQSSEATITVGDYGEWVVRVQACNSAGCGSPTTSRFEVEPATQPTPEPTPESTPEPTIVPATPTGLQAETTTDSLNVSLDWDDVDGAAHYLVRWRSIDNGEKLNEGVEVQTSNTDITVADYGEWRVRVQACNDAGCGQPLALGFKVESTTQPTPTPEPTPAPTPEPTPEPTVPATPTGLQAETTTDSLNVSLDWDDVDGAAHYLVRWRSIDNGEKLNEGVEAQSSNTDITVADYGEWRVRVQACNDAGCGQPLALGFEVESTTQPTPEPTPTPTPEPTTPPATPTGLQAETTTDSLNVSLDWDDVDGAAHYLVRWRSIDNGEKLNEGVEAQSSNTDITVADYGEWRVRVQACNDAGCGQPLALGFEVESTTQPTPTPEPTPTPKPTPDPTIVPATPTGLQADVTIGSLDVALDWEDVDGATSYLVRWRVAGPGNRLNEGVEVQSSAASISVADYGEWVVRVEACNDAGCGEHLTKRFAVEPTPGLGEIATSTPATSTPATTTAEIGLPLHFPFAISDLSLEEAGEIDDVVLPEAQGGDGEFTYTLTGLPLGLSFDPVTRTLSGTLAGSSSQARGVRSASGPTEHTLIYTATDGNGNKVSFSFTIGVKSLETARSNADDIDWRRPHVRNMAVGRKQYSEPSSPGFTVTWNAPNMSTDTNRGFENLTLADIEQYEFRYGKVGHGLTTYGTASKDSRSVVLSGLEPGTEYGVHLRVKYSGARYTEWSFANAEGRHTTNTRRSWPRAASIPPTSWNWAEATPFSESTTISRTPTATRLPTRSRPRPQA